MTELCIPTCAQAGKTLGQGLRARHGAVGDDQCRDAGFQKRACDALGRPAGAHEEDPPASEWDRLVSQIRDQADSVGGIAARLRGEGQRVHDARAPGPLTEMRTIVVGRFLERKSDIHPFAAGGAKGLYLARETVQRRLDACVLHVLAAGAREFGMDPGRLGMRHRMTDDGIAVGHSVQILSPCPKNHVRVMTIWSYSRRISGGNAAKGVAMRTILKAALSSTLRPEERSSSIDSTLPSARIVTVSRRLP